MFEALVALALSALFALLLAPLWIFAVPAFVMWFSAKQSTQGLDSAVA